jgi:hypothetical protein
MDFTEISEGTIVVNKEILFSEDNIIRFLSVSGGEVHNYIHEEQTLLVPPVLMAAKALGTMLGETGIPRGTLHTSQRIESFHRVSSDSTLKMQAAIAKNKKRAGARFLTIEISLLNLKGDVVMVTSSGLIIRSEDI